MCIMWRLEHTPDIFHDLMEILDFLVHLSPSYLYYWQEAKVYYNNTPVMFILIFFEDGIYKLSYRDIK